MRQIAAPHGIPRWEKSAKEGERRAQHIVGIEYVLEPREDRKLFGTELTFPISADHARSADGKADRVDGGAMPASAFEKPLTLFHEGAEKVYARRRKAGKEIEEKDVFLVGQTREGGVAAITPQRVGHEVAAVDLLGKELAQHSGDHVRGAAGGEEEIDPR